MITSNTTLKELFNYVCKKVETLVQSDESFIIKDLFTGIEWNRLSIKTRRELGTMFRFHIENDGCPDIIKNETKTAQNQQVYTKK